MAFEVLPSEVMGIVYGYLGVCDRLAASLVCKQWYYASCNINIWKDTAICITKEKGMEGLNMLNCERPFTCVVFQDCLDYCSSAAQSNGEDFSNDYEDCSTLFPRVVEMCKVVGWRLRVLQFKNCSISGSHFSQILAECPNLQYLSVVKCDNLFSSEMWLEEPEEINKLKLSLVNVKELDLSCNKGLNDRNFIQLAQVFTSVESLSLAECPISFQRVVFGRFYPHSVFRPRDSILTFPWIKQLVSNGATRLVSIDFSRTAIDDLALKALGQVEGLQLESIFLSECHLVTSVGVIEFFCHQKKLKRVDLPRQVAVELVLPEICANLFELRELCLRSHWPKECVPLLVSLKTNTLSKLVKLDLGSSSEVLILKFIDSLRNEAYLKLRYLSLFKGKMHDHTFMYMIPYLLHITYLDLGGTHITDRSLIMISTHLVRLQVLQLAECEAITDHGLMGHCETKNTDNVIFGNCEFLKYLVFDDCPVSVSNLKGLRELNLYNISGVSDDGVKVALVFKELRCLRLGGSSRITDEGLVAIGKNNGSLEVLSLRNSAEVTECGIARSLKYLPRLKLLDLQGCKKITDSVLHMIKGHNFKLKYLL